MQKKHTQKHQQQLTHLFVDVPNVVKTSNAWKATPNESRAVGLFMYIRTLYCKQQIDKLKPTAIIYTREQNPTTALIILIVIAVRGERHSNPSHAAGPG